MDKLGFLLLVLVWQQTFTCNTESLRDRTRLRKAKYLVDQMLKMCGARLAALAKTVKPRAARRAFVEYCKAVNACKAVVEEKIPKLVADCVSDQMRNMSGAIYTEVKVSAEYADRFADLVKCIEEKKLMEVPWEVADDALTVFNKEAMKFG